MSEFQLPVSKVAVKFHFSLSTLVVAAPKISIRLIYSESWSHVACIYIQKYAPAGLARSFVSNCITLHFLQAKCVFGDGEKEEKYVCPFGWNLCSFYGFTAKGFATMSTTVGIEQQQVPPCSSLLQL